MNILTRKIRTKGYSLLEFCEVYDIALRTYRAREKESHPKHGLLVEQIDELEGK